jgi:hypothetical protein
MVAIGGSGADRQRAQSSVWSMFTYAFFLVMTAVEGSGLYIQIAVGNNRAPHQLNHS